MLKLTACSKMKSIKDCKWPLMCSSYLRPPPPLHATGSSYADHAD